MAEPPEEGLPNLAENLGEVAYLAENLGEAANSAEDPPILAENPYENVVENPVEVVAENPDENVAENPDENVAENPDENVAENQYYDENRERHVEYCRRILRRLTRINDLYTEAQRMHPYHLHVYQVTLKSLLLGRYCLWARKYLPWPPGLQRHPDEVECHANHSPYIIRYVSMDLCLFI